MDQEIKQALSFYLDQIEDMGVGEIWKGQVDLATVAKSATTLPAKSTTPLPPRPPIIHKVLPKPLMPPAHLAINSPELQSVSDEIGDCKRCKLCSGRNSIVFGVGNPKADLIFIGEGPGADEDMAGEPFVGRAGELLTKMITGMGLTRADIYIANVVKCRPPGNRNPEPDEIASCIPFLKKQIEIINPKVIVCLGKFAAQTLLQTEIPISKLRGEFHDYRENRSIKLMPTYHPAFLLRNPEMKRPVWEDLKKVMGYLGMVKA